MIKITSKLTNLSEFLFIGYEHSFPVAQESPGNKDIAEGG